MQRYHPDKNPDSAEVAAHALKVVQAYEVLSDENRRAAYDAKLNLQLTDSLRASRDIGRDSYPSSIVNVGQVVKVKKSYWLLWLLITLTIVFCMYAITLLKGKRTDGILSTNQEILGHDGSVRTKEVLPRTIPVYISNLNVELKEFPGVTTREINIPVLGLRVGAVEADKVLRFVGSNKELIRQKLEEKLVDAKYDELIRIDGEQYLKNIVMDSIGNTIGTNRYKDDPLNRLEVVGQYGVVDILLPRSFSVH
jgi:hypothetical protein